MVKTTHLEHQRRSMAEVISPRMRSCGVHSVVVKERRRSRHSRQPKQRTHSVFSHGILHCANTTLECFGTRKTHQEKVAGNFETLLIGRLLRVPDSACFALWPILQTPSFNREPPRLCGLEEGVHHHSYRLVSPYRIGWSYLEPPPSDLAWQSPRT